MTTVMSLCSNALRGAIVASEGKKLVCSDLEQIEARVLPWLAGEQWKLDAFVEYDAGEGFDNYVMAYARAFSVAPESVDKFQRQIGKVMELALGYEGGVGAFLAFADVYGLDLDVLADSAWDTLGAGLKAKAQDALIWRRKKGVSTFGLSDKTFIVCESFKLLWRAAHPATVKLWAAAQTAAMGAIQSPGREYQVGKHLAFRKEGAWLRMILPRGDRCLCYPSARITEGKKTCPTCQGKGLSNLVAPTMEDPAARLLCSTCHGKGKVDDGDKKLSYMGVSQYSRKWERLHTYSGKLVENATQGIARDVMKHNQPLVEEAGYQILFPVHDELVCEAPDTPEFTAEGLSAILATQPPWAAGLPLAADGFESMRYRKQ